MARSPRLSSVAYSFGPGPVTPAVRALLYANIDPNLADRRFFIRKAIGWALRAYAWTDPSQVARYVREHEHLLSGLSRREALKNVPTALR